MNSRWNETVCKCKSTKITRGKINSVRTVIGKGNKSFKNDIIHRKVHYNVMEFPKDNKHKDKNNIIHVIVLLPLRNKKQYLKVHWYMN